MPKNANRPENPVEPPSKSQLKRDARALFDLGRQLVALDPAVLRSLPLEPGLREAIEAARGMRSHGARKRQLQYIGKLLRNADTAPILAAVEAIEMAARRQAARHHRIEAWRDRLLEAGDAAVTELVAQRPRFSPQALRQLLRNARREKELNKPPAAARKLFGLLRDIDDVEPLPPFPEER